MKHFLSRNSSNKIVLWDTAEKDREGLEISSCTITGMKYWLYIYYMCMYVQPDRKIIYTSRAAWHGGTENRS